MAQRADERRPRHTLRRAAGQTIVLRGRLRPSPRRRRSRRATGTLRRVRSWTRIAQQVDIPYLFPLHGTAGDRVLRETSGYEPVPEAHRPGPAIIPSQPEGLRAAQRCPRRSQGRPVGLRGSRHARHAELSVRLWVAGGGSFCDRQGAQRRAERSAGTVCRSVSHDRRRQASRRTL